MQRIYTNKLWASSHVDGISYVLNLHSERVQGVHECYIDGLLGKFLFGTVGPRS